MTEGAQQMLTTSEVARKTGASLRQLQYWDERLILRPLGGIRDHKRLYTEDQIGVVKQFVQLRRAGVSMQNLRQLRLRLSEWKTVVTTKRSAVVVGDVLVVFTGKK